MGPAPVLSVAELAQLVVLWTIAAWWWRHHRREQTWLCISLMSLALTGTLQSATVYRLVEASMGVPAGATLAIQICNVAVLATFWEALCVRLSGTRRTSGRTLRGAAAIGAALVMVVSFSVGYAVSGPRWPATDDAVRFATEPGPLVAFLWVYGGYAGAALVGCSWLSMRHARRTRHAVTRLALILIGSATTVALLQHLSTLAVLAGAVGWPRGVVDRVGRYVLDGVFLMIAAGMALPALSGQIARWATAHRERRAFRQLEPLWSRLSTAIPDIVLLPPRLLPDPWLRLYRRVIETWDGVLTVSSWISPSMLRAAEQVSSRQRRWPRRRMEATVAAICLEAALRARQNGHEPAGTPAEALRLCESGSFATELRSLTAVARAWSSPAVQKAATRVLIATHRSRAP
jgi:hypothetical protein